MTLVLTLANHHEKNTTRRFYTGNPVFKFGEGMSYSSFELKIDSNATAGRVTVRAHNPSAIAGDAVVLLFCSPPEGIAGVDGAPIQNLAAYDRVHLRPRERASVHFDLPQKTFMLANAGGELKATPGAWRFWVGSGDGKAGALASTIVHVK